MTPITTAAGIVVWIGLNDLLASIYNEHLIANGIGPILLEVPTTSTVYMGDPVPEGLLFKTGQVAGTCVATMPKTKGVKKLKTQVVIAYDVGRLILSAYNRGVADGSHGKRYRCDVIRGAMRRFDTMLKQALLSQDPSFPRKKSKTGVTRIGRKRKGPG